MEFKSKITEIKNIFWFVYKHIRYNKRENSLTKRLLFLNESENEHWIKLSRASRTYGTLWINHICVIGIPEKERQEGNKHIWRKKKKD